MASRLLFSRGAGVRLAAGGAAAVAASAGTVAYCAGARVTSEKQIGGTKWIHLYNQDYVDDNGVARKWDMVQRAGKPGVVSVLPILTSKAFKPGEEETLLTCQFRPALHAYCLELPAAIVGPGETAEECAVRCIQNETGYNATVRAKTPPLSSSAGLTSETVSIVIVDVNLDDYTEETTVTKTTGKRRRRGMKKTTKVQGTSWIPEQTLDDDQIIAIQKIKLKDLQIEIENAEKEGVVPAFALQSLATGMSLMGASAPGSEAPKKKMFGLF